MRKYLLSILLATLVFMGCGNRQSSNYEDIPTAYQQKLLEEGWTMKSPQEGDMPEGYGIEATTGIVDNYFDIELGGELDMAVKIVNVETDKPVRYVYVPAGSTTTINELPAGKYYLKLTYGKGWMMTYTDGKMVGKFTKETNYEKSTSIFDFGSRNSLDAVSYFLKIHIKHNPRYESFSTTEISEQEFFED